MIGGPLDCIMRTHRLQNAVSTFNKQWIAIHFAGKYKFLKSLNLMAFFMHIWGCTLYNARQSLLFYINLDVMVKVSAYINESYLFIDGGTANRNADVVTLYSLCGLRAALHGNIIFKSIWWLCLFIVISAVEMRPHFFYICLFGSLNMFAFYLCHQ